MLAGSAVATKPLTEALDALGALPGSGEEGRRTLEQRESEEDRHIEAIARKVANSLRHFGPRYMLEGLIKIRNMSVSQLGNNVVDRVLTDVLKASIDRGFPGSLADWERVLRIVADTFVDSIVPITMLQVAVSYAKTGDERHLFGVPLEQRRLLESIRPPAASNPDWS